MVLNRSKERKLCRRFVMLEVGLRVVRGPDWKWGCQDDGEGHVGTVVEIGKAGSNTSPDKTVVVQWDSGSRTNYRVGYQGAHDLKVYDNAPAGVKHPNIICDGCKKHGIAGMRWKCGQCFDYDLCTLCYMADKHDVTHQFQRYETASSTGAEVPLRKNGEKSQLKGIFVGAKVMRGPDWDWGNQDGGEGKSGRVIDIRGWDNESGRSVANVTWTSGSTNVYRLGHKGKVDLKYVQEATGGSYYRDHLPVLGKSVEQQPGATKLPSSPRHNSFCVGDKVKVLVDLETLKQMQDGHGGWNPRMVEYIGKVGVIHRVTERSDIRVQYDGGNRWTFHPGALTKLTSTVVAGDVVQVIDDPKLVREYQVGHGEWIEAMKNALGKMGKVIKIYTDGDLRVNLDGQTWTFNPLCVRLVPGSATELNNTMNSHQRTEHTNPLAAMLPNLLEHQFQSSSLDRLVREAAQGHGDIVRDLIQKFPERVDQKSSGKTCLQVACHQGHMDIVKMLIASKANLEIADDDGDTALHYSAFGNQADVMDILLKAGACLDTLNKGKCSALHVAVNKQHIDCVRLLLKYKCNVNIQDSYGDTALHDAIGKESVEIIDMLINVAGIDFTLKNARGFNVLHHAALKGNNFATERLTSKTRQMADLKKDDGFSALHLASLNGHRQVTETLLIQGQCEIDIRNNRKQTSLSLAVSQGHASIVELLVLANADIHAEDEDGETGLHVALMKIASVAGDVSEVNAPYIHRIHSQLVFRAMDHPLGLALACFLVQKGSDLNKKNHKGKSPIELVQDPVIVELLKSYVPGQRSISQATTNRPAPLPPVVSVDAISPVPSTSTSVPTVPSPSPLTNCMICQEDMLIVTFEPCGHKICCEDCCQRMKKCLKCKEPIVKKVASDGRLISHETRQRQHSADRLQFLENKIAEIEEAHCCSICMERRRNVAFLCGHVACEKCAQTLKTCHMCRKPITKKINLY